jgi:hypothetical protein
MAYATPLQHTLLQRLAAHGGLMDADTVLLSLPEHAADELGALVRAGSVVQLSRTGQFHLAGGRMARHAAQHLMRQASDVRLSVLGRVEAGQGGRRLYRLGMARRVSAPGAGCTAGLDALVMAEIEIPLPAGGPEEVRVLEAIAHRLAAALDAPPLALAA